MDTRCIACEQNFLIPEYVTIDRLKEEQQKKISMNCTTTQVPEVNASKEELINTFSLNTNEYLKCKWTQFMENVPENVIVIKSYKEYKRKKSPVRKMILNGEFYLRSGQLIPIPHVAGQRT